MLRMLRLLTQHSLEGVILEGGNIQKLVWKRASKKGELKSMVRLLISSKNGEFN